MDEQHEHERQGDVSPRAVPGEPLSALCVRVSLLHVGKCSPDTTVKQLSSIRCGRCYRFYQTLRIITCDLCQRSTHPSEYRAFVTAKFTPALIAWFV